MPWTSLGWSLWLTCTEWGTQFGVSVGEGWTGKTDTFIWSLIIKQEYCYWVEQIFVLISFISFFLNVYIYYIQYKKCCHVRDSSDEILWWTIFLSRWSSKHLAYSCLFASTLLSVPPNQQITLSAKDQLIGGAKAFPQLRGAKGTQRWGVEREMGNGTFEGKEAAY